VRATCRPDSPVRTRCPTPLRCRALLGDRRGAAAVEYGLIAALVAITVLIGVFALGALLLSSMGLYGVIASAVTRRRHELAVRIALGANHGRVLRLVLGDGARLISLGLLIGVPCTWLAGRAVRGALVGISATDPVTLAAVAAGLGGVALAACYIPARRVLGIQPSSTLRSDSA
jgi:putative ABC transport system permease protein